MYAVCYILALFTEILRCFSNRRVFAVAAPVFVAAGMVWQSIFLYQHHLAGVNLLGAAQMYFQVSAWGLVVIYLYWTFRHPKNAFGIVLLSVVLCLLTGSYLVASGNIEKTGTHIPLVMMTHTVMIFLATVSLTIGGISGIYYLLQDYLLHRKRLPSGNVALPTLEWSLDVCKESIRIAAVFLGLCIVTGCYLYSQTPPRTSLVDPLTCGAVVIFFFLYLCSGSPLFFAKYNGGRRVVFVTLIAFALLVMTIILGLITGTAHWL